MRQDPLKNYVWWAPVELINDTDGCWGATLYGFETSHFVRSSLMPCSWPQVPPRTVMWRLNLSCWQSGWLHRPLHHLWDDNKTSSTISGNISSRSIRIYHWIVVVKGWRVTCFIIAVVWRNQFNHSTSENDQGRFMYRSSISFSGAHRSTYLAFSEYSTHLPELECSRPIVLLHWLNFSNHSTGYLLNGE